MQENMKISLTILSLFIAGCLYKDKLQAIDVSKLIFKGKVYEAEAVCDELCFYDIQIKEGDTLTIFNGNRKIVVRSNLNFWEYPVIDFNKLDSSFVVLE
jgi:hypothetical protein